MNREKKTVIIGGGIVGLAIGYKLLQKDPNRSLLILEKEKQIATHQTGHNSGVVHSGIYYKPGSYKAKNCLEGKKLLKSFCEEVDAPYQEVGKLIVATTQEEVPYLNTLYSRGTQNGVEAIELVDSQKMKEIEPSIHPDAKQGLYVPHVAITDYRLISEALLKEITKRNGSLQTNTECLNIQEKNDKITLETTQGVIECGTLINASGVFADDIARKSGFLVKERIIPFRGEYYHLKEETAKKIKGLIYPVPDPRFPFLGVHLTKKLLGGVEVGPNAVLAFSKEGYTFSSVDFKFLRALLSYPGFWKMALKYGKTGVQEMMRSLSKEAFLRSLQKLVPELTIADLVEGGSGVRAQLVFPDGSLCDDFCIQRSKNMVHILNAPSPAATASLAIADHIVNFLI